MSGGLDGRGVLVILGDQGDGREVVRRAAQYGAWVVFSAPPGSEEVVSAVLEEAGAERTEGRVSAVAVDLSSQAGVDSLFDAVGERLPGLHALVVWLRQAAYEVKPLAETSLDDWNRAFSVYLRRPFLITQRAVEELLVGGEGGRIVYVVRPATGERDGAAQGTGMAAAVTALASLVRSVTKEYGRRGIACNAVLAREGSASAAQHAAEMALFLASGEASFVNGEVLEVSE